MTTETLRVLSEALRLDEPDRALIAQELLQTLSPNSSDFSDDQLEAQLDQRLQEFHQDPSVAVSWSELKRELLG